MTDKAKQAVEDAKSCLETYGLNGEDQAVKTIQFALALTKQVMQEGWQPIETAPKDGTVILVINGQEGGYGGSAGESSAPYNIGTAYFLKHGNGTTSWMANDCCDGVSTYKPTHWKPLEQPSEKMIKEFMEDLNDGK